MVFKANGAKTFKLRVVTRDRRSATCSTGTTERAVANDVEGMVKRFRRQRRWDILDAIVLKQVTLGRVYDADAAGTLDVLMAELTDVDLEPLVADWAVRANAKYVGQVRKLIPKGQRFPRSRFRRREISAFLAGLSCDDPTKNRYRAALSVFAKWLVEREVLETNVVRDVAMYAEHDPRMVWMTWADAIRVRDAAEEPYRTLFCLMAATGIELSAALKIQRTDVDLTERTIAVRGTKTPWRNRVVRFEEWATYNLTQHCRPLVGFAPLFPGLTKYRPIRVAFRAAQKAVGLSGHRLHDLRHTYAVNALKKGYKPQVVAHQLGHKDAMMVTKVYGRFVPDESDYVVTKPAKQRKAR